MPFYWQEIEAVQPEGFTIHTAEQDLQSRGEYYLTALQERQDIQPLLRRAKERIMS
jgi:DNA primase